MEMNTPPENVQFRLSNMATQQSIKEISLNAPKQVVKATSHG